MPGMPVIVVSSAALVDELCDEKRFDKSTKGTLRRLRALSHGLFTSDTHESTWSKPHNILLANFSQRAMQAYHPMMLDIAEQLVTKWERLNFDEEVDVVRDMTALTLDTIGLCGFGYRFNSFYREGFHPFVDAMVRTLETVQNRRGIPLEELMLKKELAQQRKDIRFMHKMVEDIIQRAARTSGADIATKPDLLSYMIAGVDKKTGERLDDKHDPRRVHRVPDRRPRDHQRPAVLRDLLPAEQPRGDGQGAGRGRQRVRPRPFGEAHLRAGQPAASTCCRC